MGTYPWPGNVRELNNVIERAMLLYDDAETTLDDLPESIAATVAASPGTGPASDSAHRLRLPEQWLTKPLHEVREAFLSDLERQYIEALLTDAVDGKISRKVSLLDTKPACMVAVSIRTGTSWCFLAEGGHGVGGRRVQGSCLLWTHDVKCATPLRRSPAALVANTM